MENIDKSCLNAFWRANLCLSASIIKLFIQGYSSEKNQQKNENSTFNSDSAVLKKHQRQVELFCWLSSCLWSVCAVNLKKTLTKTFPRT